MKYNFDEIVQRKHTDCIKYDNLKEMFGTEEVLPMWIADMDFKTPDFIVDAIRNRLSHELLGYSYICHRWRPAIQSWVSRRYGWQVEADEIGFVGGIVPAISFALQCFTKAGDKVMIQPPVYHPYHHVTHDLERTLVFNPLKELLQAQHHPQQAQQLLLRLPPLIQLLMHSLICQMKPVLRLL